MVPNLSFSLRLLICFAALFPPIPSCPALAQQADAPSVKAAHKLSVRVGEHKDFDRLAFDKPRGMTFDVKQQDGKVSLTFNGDASLGLGPAAKLTRATAFQLERKEDNGNARTIISFSVSPLAKVKHFTNGPTLVVDIFGPATGKVSAAPEKTSPDKTSLNIRQNPALPPPETKTAPLPSTPEKTAGKTAEPPLSAENAPAQTKPAAEIKEKPEENAVKPPDADETAKKDVDIAKAKNEPDVPPVAEAPKPEAAPTPAPPLAAPVAPAPKAQTVVAPKAPELVAVLDPKITVGAAVFARAGYVTILFDRKLGMDVSSLSGGSPPRVALEPFDLPKNNGYRFALPPESDVRATREGTAWKVFLVQKTMAAAISTRFVLQPNFALGPRILIPTTNGPEAVKFTDPVVGDTLVAVPLRETSAYSVQRRMADFILLPAAQGLVFKPLHEKVTARTFPDGIEISAEGGLRLSPSDDTGVKEHTFTNARVKSSRAVFDLAVWRGATNENFTRRRQKLMQTIVGVPPSQRNLARLELARFYFSRGMGEETLALLNYLAKQVPEIAAHPEFLALRGAANILVARTFEALLDLAHPLLAPQAEIQLWQAVGSAQIRDWKTAEEKFDYTQEIWSLYPEPFHSRFALLAIESALSLDKDQQAAEWLESLQNRSQAPEIQPGIKYLQGVIHSKTGKSEAAEQLWKSATRSSNRLYKIRAELALVDLGLATNSLSLAQAIERLEGLRYAWRGDDLELDILQRLGSLQIEAKDFKKGLAALQQGVRLYPNSPLTPPIREQMTKTFHDVFMTELGESMSPIEAMSMYQDFRDLVPKGEEGVALKLNLTERLVAIDLLDQAASLLEDLLKNGLKGEERASVGARLAAIQLLDQKPLAALDALDRSQGDVPAGPSAEQLREERLMLRARALSQQGQFDAALALLHNNSGHAAKMLKADITMRAQRWSEAAKALADIIGPPPQPQEKLTEEKAGWLVNSAIALSLAGDNAALDRLAIDFGKAMDGTSQKDMFRILTRPDKSMSMKNLAAAQAKITEVDMFRGFLDTYRGEPTPKANDAKKAK